VHRSLRWRHLVPGAVILGVILVGTAATLKFARIGRLSGDTVRYFMALPSARNVMGGTEVWINGAKVGRVSKVRFAPPSVDTARRVVIEVEVLQKHREQIRENSLVRLGTGASLMGPTVVYITAGSPDARVVSANDTIRSDPGGDIQALTASVGEVTREFPALMANVKVLTSSLASTKGTIGALTTLDAPERLDALVDNATRLTDRATTGNGTLALAMGRGALVARANAAKAQADSLRALVAGNQGAIGRFRRDSTLLRAVAEVRDELSITGALLSSGSGTLGRFAQDSIIAVQMTEMSRQMSELFADIKRRPFRYISF
jgi:ABC-type transporter Mla subunit MlaD